MNYFTNRFIIRITYRPIKLTKQLSLHIAVIFILFVLTVAPVHAYEFPPYMGFSLKVDGNLTETYNNNLTFANNEENRIEDFMTMLTFGIVTKYEGKRNMLGLTGKLNRRIKTETSDITNSSENLTLNYRRYISEYDMLSVGNTYTHTQLPGSFAEEFDMIQCRDELEKTGRSVSEVYAECNRFKDEFGRFKGRYDTYRNNLNFAYNKFISEQINIGTGYIYGQNWSNQEGTQDSNSNKFNFKVACSYSELTRFSLSYRHANSKYGSGNVISTDTISAGINRYLTKRLMINGSAGVVFQPNATNNSFSASITDEIDEKTSASLSYSKSIDISSDTENIFRNWQVIGQFNRQLLEDLRSSVSVFYGKRFAELQFLEE